MSLENNLYKIAKTRLQNDDDINDAIQETMILAFKSINKLKNIEFFKTWIIKILINNCNNIYRKKKKELPFDESIDENYSTNNNLDDILDFEFLIQYLNYDERIVLTLYYMEDYTNKEIGKILNTSENTIKSRILRAKNKIKKMYKEDK